MTTPPTTHRPPGWVEIAALVLMAAFAGAFVGLPACLALTDAPPALVGGGR